MTTSKARVRAHQAWESRERDKGNRTFTARLSRPALQTLQMLADHKGCSRTEALESILLDIRGGFGGGPIADAMREHRMSYEEAVAFTARNDA